MTVAVDAVSIWRGSLTAPSMARGKATGHWILRERYTRATRRLRMTG